MHGNLSNPKGGQQQHNATQRNATRPFFSLASMQLGALSLSLSHTHSFACIPSHGMAWHEMNGHDFTTKVPSTERLLLRPGGKKATTTTLLKKTHA